MRSTLLLIVVSLAFGTCALAQGQPEPKCKTPAEIARLTQELQLAEAAANAARNASAGASEVLLQCEAARGTSQACAAELRDYNQKQAAFRTAETRVTNIKNALARLEALPVCVQPTTPPPPPPPKPPTPDPQPPGGKPRSITITHRGSCPPCAEIAAKFNKAAEDYAAAVSKGTLDEPLAKHEMEELGRELDACEQRMCTSPGTVPGVTRPSPPNDRPAPPPNPSTLQPAPHAAPSTPRVAPGPTNQPGGRPSGVIR